MKHILKLIFCGILYAVIIKLFDPAVETMSLLEGNNNNFLLVICITTGGLLYLALILGTMVLTISSLFEYIYIIVTSLSVIQFKKKNKHIIVDLPEDCSIAGKDGASVYEIWKSIPGNKDKSVDEFMNDIYANVANKLSSNEEKNSEEVQN